MGRLSAAALVVCCLLFAGSESYAQQPRCRTIKADVVAIDQAYQVNRLGTSRPGGLLFALRHDVESTDPTTAALQAGRVQLKSYKRPRPMVLRANVGDCIEIRFQNLLAKTPTDPVQPATRNVSLHVAGMSVRDSITSDGTWVGQNPPGITGKSGGVAPGESIVYSLYANAEGSYLVYSTPGDYNNFGTMQLTMGLFGALNVEPLGAEWYRSQVTEADMAMATTGTFPSGHPKINYDAVYPAQHPRAGKPILRMLDGGNNLVHSDLTAVITGPNRGLFPGGKGNNPVLPDRDWPFREVTIHYHESQDLVQAFPYFYPQGNPPNGNVPTVNAGSDSFAINYGVGGIGPTVLANRIGVGPSTDCVECKFEEFFLSSWPLGDPGLVVDVPANAEQSTPCLLDAIYLGDAARGNVSRPCVEARKRPTKAFYPDDPSNVYHTYLGDHVMFRILHAGAAVTHVHHHHAHQWLHAWQDQDSNYLDSQSIGPGASFTLDLVYNGSGNRNLTVGDSIFHCHFYPHFASGMWGLFRVHDVFEGGTRLDEAQRPARGGRALPDPQIATGTPIPAVVPLPIMGMAPMPSKVEIVDGQVKHSDPNGFPGYPFYIPGVSGHRAPHPPLDFAVDPKTKETYDGGLPRHLVTGGVVANEAHSPTDWSKDLVKMTAYQLPEGGTPVEVRAMTFFSTHLHPSYAQNGQQQPFRVNGLPRGPRPGAPFADPAVVDGKAVGNDLPHPYRGVNLQVDTVFNKAGWHYPQQRLMALWQDVPDLVSGVRPPQPHFFRAASNDVVEYWHTNLVPAYYELDDFQVRTPTDILGQHIHLVKFDVTSSDGAGNGFNYEDGTFSPEEVRGRIAAINADGGLWNYARTAQTTLQAKEIEELGKGPNNDWIGAQATVQRWWVDPLMDSRGNDRTYMTVFTHDHFGPSTHQMAGLYGGLLVEPRHTTWWSLDGKERYRDWTKRNDGGPTGYAANIIYDDPVRAGENYREFALAWADLQLVYNSDSRHKPDCYTYVYQGKRISQTGNCTPLADGAPYQGWSEAGLNANAIINCAQCTPAKFPPVSSPFTPASTPASPSPNLIADFGFGMMSLNYRAEPIPLRLSPAVPPGTNNTTTTVTGSTTVASTTVTGTTVNAGDLSTAFASITRPTTAFSTQPAGGSQINPACKGAECFKFPVQPISQGMQATDPFTPLLAGYEGDKVQFRLLVGAHTSMHDFTLNGLRWLYAPFSENSGYRSTQFMILSEHFEPIFELPRIGANPSADYLYNPTASYEGLTNGLWGILRSFNPQSQQTWLAPLPQPLGPHAPLPARPQPVANTDCTKPQPCTRHFNVYVKPVTDGLIYNSRGIHLGNKTFDAAHPLVDPNALVYVRGDQPVDGATIQPLVLRARAGDWIRITLHNHLTGNEPVFQQANAESAGRFSQIPYAFPYQNVMLTPSPNVGLHAQLVDYDVTKGDGMTVGKNPIQTAAPGQKTEYVWYAGIIEDGQTIPVEFGAVNLLPADPLMHVYHGLFGTLVIEPQDATWVEDPQSPTAATVFTGNQVFREFVLMAQNDANITLNGSQAYAAGMPLSAVNYKSEPPFYRYGALWASGMGVAAPQDWTNLSIGDLTTIGAEPTTAVDTTRTTANELVGGDPQTPILRAPAGMPVRIHILEPGGIGDNQQVFELTGHVWQETPYTDRSTKIGYNPKSYYNGQTSGFGPTTSYPIVLAPGGNGNGTPAGGRFGVPGDYLWRSWTANQFQAGLWGIFRVAPNNGPGFPDTVGITSVRPSGTGYVISGFTTVSPRNNRKHADKVTLQIAGRRVTARVVNGLWTYRGTGPMPKTFAVSSPFGGTATWGVPGPIITEEHGAPLRRHRPQPRNPRSTTQSQ